MCIGHIRIFGISHVPNEQGTGYEYLIPNELKNRMN